MRHFERPTATRPEWNRFGDVFSMWRLENLFSLRLDLASSRTNTLGDVFLESGLETSQFNKLTAVQRRVQSVGWFACFFPTRNMFWPCVIEWWKIILRGSNVFCSCFSWHWIKLLALLVELEPCCFFTVVVSKRRLCVSYLSRVSWSRKTGSLVLTVL